MVENNCPNCKETTATTVPQDQYTFKRTCTACGYKWLGMFTPAGFVPLPTEGNKTQ